MRLIAISLILALAPAAYAQGFDDIQLDNPRINGSLIDRCVVEENGVGNCSDAGEARAARQTCLELGFDDWSQYSTGRVNEAVNWWVFSSQGDPALRPHPEGGAKDILRILKCRRFN